MQEPSIFTRIINGEIPCYKIYEDDRVIAFLDIHPINPGHTLVVPKLQIDHIWDLPDDDYDYLWKIVKKVGLRIREVMKCPRVGIQVEGMDVPHCHVKLVPIYERPDFRKVADQGEPDHAKLAEVASLLKM